MYRLAHYSVSSLYIYDGELVYNVAHYRKKKNKISQDRAVVARRGHSPKVVGSNPSPAISHISMSPTDKQV